MSKICTKGNILKYLLYLLNAILAVLCLAILINSISLVGPLQGDFEVFPIVGIIYGLSILLLSVFGDVAALRKSSRLICIFAIVAMLLAVIQVITLFFYNESYLKRKLYRLFSVDSESFKILALNLLWHHPKNTNELQICLSKRIASNEDCDLERINDFNGDAKYIINISMIIFAVLTLLKGILFAVAINLAYILKEEQEKRETASPLEQKPGCAVYTRA